MITTPSVFAALVLSLGISTVQGDSWPGWRGPGGNGIASGSPPIEFSADLNVRWKVALPGKGSSCPVVWGERVFVTTAVGTGVFAEAADEPEAEDRPERGSGERGGGRGEGRERGGARGGRLEEQQFLVVALERGSGAALWETAVRTALPHQGTHSDGSYATPTPVSDGEHVIASFGSYGVYALTMDGELVWEKDLGDMDITRGFGEGSSPVLIGDTLIVNWDHSGESFLVALDKKTGAEKWRHERESGTSWTTPLVVSHGDERRVVVGTTRTACYDLETGDEVWTYGESGGRGGGVITSPVAHDGRLLLATGSRDGALLCLNLEAPIGEGGTLAAPTWSAAGDTPHVPSPLAYQGVVYMLKQNSGILSAFDVASGERVFGPERMQGVTNAYASPVAAGGRIYFADRDGAVEVIAAGREYEPLAINKLDDAFDASPAIAGDELFLRGRSHLYCIAKDEE